MPIAPSFGNGKIVNLNPAPSGSASSGTPRWVWYAGGAVVGLGLIVVLRRGSGGATGAGTPALSTTPNASDTGQISNLANGLQSLQNQLNTGGGATPTTIDPTTTPSKIPLPFWNPGSHISYRSPVASAGLLTPTAVPVAVGGAANSVAAKTRQWWYNPKTGAYSAPAYEPAQNSNLGEWIKVPEPDPTLIAGGGNIPQPTSTPMPLQNPYYDSHRE